LQCSYDFGLIVKVTVSKTTLEKAAKLSSDFTRQLSEIQVYVDSLRDELIQKEDIKTVENFSDELHWSQVVLITVALCVMWFVKCI